MLRGNARLPQSGDAAGYGILFSFAIGAVIGAAIGGLIGGIIGLLVSPLFWVSEDIASRLKYIAPSLSWFSIESNPDILKNTRDIIQNLYFALEKQGIKSDSEILSAPQSKNAFFHNDELESDQEHPTIIAQNKGVI